MRKLIHALLLAAIVTCLTAGSATATGTCAHPHGPFTVSANKMHDGAGKVFTPTGITVYGLAQPDWQNHLSADLRQIAEIGAHWCANTVRIQGAPEALFSGVHGSINPAWVESLEKELTAARAAGLNTVLSAQTELFHGPPMPTAQTVEYWRYLAGVLRGQSDLIFDIFNEPRYAGSNAADMWRVWRDGGAGYVGMNALAKDIRSWGYGRLLWVQGPRAGATLARLPRYHLVSKGIVYDVHHPLGTPTIAHWNADFGAAASRYPVVLGEWTQYANTTGECWRGHDVAGRVAAFLNYLRQRQIGLISWTLNVPGVLVDATGKPTRIDKRYACTAAARATTTEGAGTALLRFFQAVNR